MLPDAPIPLVQWRWTDADQIEFIEQVIDHLTGKGAVDPKLLYASPFIDIAPSGPKRVFSIERSHQLVRSHRATELECWWLAAMLGLRREFS